MALLEDDVWRLGEMMYFVISNSDGDTYVRQMGEDELLKELNPDACGDVILDSAEVLRSLAEVDTNCWGGKFLIIRGEIVVPREEQVVTRVTI